MFDRRIIKTAAKVGELQISLMEAYLQGAADCWCNAKPNDWFTASDLVAQQNGEWGGTPLEALSKAAANSELLQDIERLLVKVLRNHKRRFQYEPRKQDNGEVLAFLWLREEDGETEAEGVPEKNTIEPIAAPSSTGQQPEASSEQQTPPQYFN